MLDRRDVPGWDTPLHFAVKFDDLRLAGTDAGVSFQNKTGWNPSMSLLLLPNTKPAFTGKKGDGFLVWKVTFAFHSPTVIVHSCFLQLVRLTSFALVTSTTGL